MQNHSPKVTFVVPCYKLAHLLRDCVTSILAQTYRDFEVLIMDDCSPDDTPEVARSFDDPRVRHIRNEPNLGHLRNYNKGISLAAGEYIWLISADDRLRAPHVLERYVEAMESHPRVGFAFCPGFGLKDDRETDIVSWGTLNRGDAILDGRTFLYRLVESNCVLAPAVLVRRECYERVALFPLDLPFAGDWYLWCAFALRYDVAYFSEPMVNYREHSGSMTDAFVLGDIARLSRDEMAVRWRIKADIERLGHDEALARQCRNAIVHDYVRALSSKTCRGVKFRMSLMEFDRSLLAHARDQLERETIRRQVLKRVGRHLHWDGHLASDPEVYRLAIKYGGPRPKLCLKYALLRLGPLGHAVMRRLSNVRSAIRHRQPRGA